MSGLIDRQVVLDLFQDNVCTLHNYARVWEAVEEMPSVTPTESVIEDIKAEIEEKRDLLMKQGGVYEHSAYGLDYAILIIDGHIEKENE